mgnify:CR=1 FL=1
MSISLAKINVVMKANENSYYGDLDFYVFSEIILKIK